MSCPDCTDPIVAGVDAGAAAIFCALFVLALASYALAEWIRARCRRRYLENEFLMRVALDDAEQLDLLTPELGPRQRPYWCRLARFNEDCQ